MQIFGTKIHAWCETFFNWLTSSGVTKLSGPLANQVIAAIHILVACQFKQEKYRKISVDGELCKHDPKMPSEILVVSKCKHAFLKIYGLHLSSDIPLAKPLSVCTFPGTGSPPPYDQLCDALLLSAGVVAMTNGSDPEAGSGSQWCSITLISICLWYMWGVMQEAADKEARRDCCKPALLLRCINHMLSWKMKTFSYPWSTSNEKGK